MLGKHQWISILSLYCWLDVTVRNIPQLVSTQVFFVFLGLQKKFLEGFQFPSCFSVLIMQPSIFKIITVPLVLNTTKMSVQIIHFSTNYQIKIPGPCNKPLILSIAMYSFSYNYCQKDERGKPGNFTAYHFSHYYP